MITRRSFVSATLAAVIGQTATGPGATQTWPARPIKIIVPFPAGGASDVMARLLADRLSPALGQTVIVENPPGGAGGSIGAKADATADPDGYTLLVCPLEVLTQAPLVYKNVDYEPRSFAPIALLMSSANAIVVHPSLPVRTLPQLAAYAKANPGKIRFGSPGFGTTPHLIGELFGRLTGAEIIHVPYRGSAPAINDLLAAQVQMYMDSLTVLLALIEGGNLRPLAVASDAPSPYLPDVPTTVASGFPMLQTVYRLGLYAPLATPANIVEMLNRSVNDALKSTKIQEGLRKLGADAMGGSAQSFAAFMLANAKASAEMVAAAGVEPQ
jgi:tripartite-type tricarboxylate transporter receptor subunit TctC